MCVISCISNQEVVRTSSKMKLLLLSIICATYGAVSAQEKLKVSVYYESLCPDSIRFVVRQLLPAYQVIQSSVAIDFVPYGKATQKRVDGVWEFRCQHGPNECWGNKVQACELGEGHGQDKDTAFVTCVMGKRNPASNESMSSCASEAGIDWNPIIGCATSSRGGDLLAIYGDQTHALQPRLSFVPTIVFNDKYDAALQKRALVNFLSTVCDLLAEKKPQACQKY